MGQAALRRTIRESGLFEQVNPPEVMRQQQAAAQVIDPTGALLRDAVRPFLPPFRYRFHAPGPLTVTPAGGMDMVVRAGTLIRLSAHVGTAPAGGSCIVQLRDSSANVLATVTIPSGQVTGDSPDLNAPLLAGQWIGPHVTQANGAADLSVVATEQAG